MLHYNKGGVGGGWKAPAAGILHLNQAEVDASGELVSVCCL